MANGNNWSCPTTADTILSLRRKASTGAYVHYPDNPGDTNCRVTYSPYGPHDTPTPGTPYYFNRRVLGEHALRYMDENPIAAMRLSDPCPDAHSYRRL